MNFSRTYKLPVIIFLVTGFLFSCRNEIEEINAITGDIDMPVQTSYNAWYDYTDNGKMLNKLIATQLDRFVNDQPRLEASGGFELIMYDSLELPEARLTAERGVFLEKEHILRAYYNVLLTNNKGDSLQTEELIWLQDSGKIYSDKEVIISSKDGKLFGKGMESDERFNHYTIRKPHGSFKIEEQEDGKAE